MLSILTEIFELGSSFTRFLLKREVELDARRTSLDSTLEFGDKPRLIPSKLRMHSRVRRDADKGD